MASIYKMTESTKINGGIKCLPLGSNGRAAGIAQIYGTNQSTAYDRNQLLNALNENIPGINGNLSKMINLSNLDSWKSACILENDSPDDYELILLQEEEKHLKNPSGIRWLKFAIRVINTDNIMTGSITNYNDPGFINKKSTKRSKIPNWYIDTRTTLTDREFWVSLKNII